ncbi:STAS domain-containing protein [Streptomyces sp. SL13]|jgi:anti-anti-sigma factor|uniref:STAS domain-containing protein n=1 Tax=Streptantibioticus silvisoli TaxID=2705255 RepID=A0AA90KFG7_9ACTN|nr:STAS domain-containing protein [Streptantibioticus silvisoli]MDI5961264.1 STAS domain-containing protein [Streptantibioticus silvisoli]MDI5968894.1 STAS domain-containing protein [Streptantibioticus silvisoli]
MTMMPSARLRLTTVDTEATVRIELRGDLDYDNADRLLAAVTGQLAGRPRLEHLHLHCAGLGTVDSMGLSVLLMIHRRTGEAGVRLHLDDRTARLDRLLTITGTLEHLTASPNGAASSPAGAGESPKNSAEARAARPTGPDGTT